MRVFTLLVVMVVAFPVFAQDQAAVSAATPLKAGAAKRSIVPPFPTTMAGFFDRTANFEGVKTPIYARALVCANEETSLAILATDLLWMPRELADAVRGDVSAATGIPAANILLCAAHNHSSLAGFSKGSLFGGPFNQALFDFLRAEMGHALTEAHAALRPAALGFGQGRLDGFARNRQQGNEDVIDPAVGVLRVTEADSRTVIATLFNFTGHPVILGSDNLLLCGEYPGAAEQMVEDVLGGVALFTQGACGDVTVKRSGPPFLEVERLGRILGAEVIKTSEMTPPGAETFLFSCMEDVPVEPRILPEPPIAQERLAAAQKSLADAKTSGAAESEILRLERVADSAEWAVRLSGFKVEHPDAFPEVRQAPVQVMQIGPLVVVGIPGELFVEYGLEMKQRVKQGKNRPMILAGYANDYLGYLVTPRAVHTGGYEQATARLEASAPRAMTEAAMAWVDAGVR